MSTAVRERVLKEALERGEVTTSDVREAERRREEYRRFGVDVPILELLATAGRLPVDRVEDAARGEEIPSRIAGLEVVRAAGGDSAELPVFLARRTLDNEACLVQACMRARGEAPTEVDAFLRAAEDGRRLTGAGWVGVSEVAGADGAYAAVYPVPDGIRLDDRLAAGDHLAPHDAVDFLRRIAEALWQLEALGRAVAFPDPSLVLVGPDGRPSLVAMEVLLATRPGGFDPREFARSAANVLARLVGPERVTDPAVRDLLADLASGRLEALRPTGASTARAAAAAPRAPTVETETPAGLATPVGLAAPTMSPRSTIPSVPRGTPVAPRTGVPRGVLAVGALAVGVVAVVFFGNRAPSVDPAPPPSSEPTAPRAGSSSPRAPDPSRDATSTAGVRDDGLTALDDALAYLASHRTEDPRGVIDRLRAVEARYGGSDAGTRAGVERERFRREVEDDAQRRVEAIAHDVARFLSADEIGAAQAAIGAFPGELAFTEAVVRLDALRKQVKDKAESIYTALRPALDAAVDPARRDAAAAALERVKALGDREITARAEQRLREALGRGDGRSARRKDLEPELDRVLGDVLVAAGVADVERARRALDAAGRGALGDVFPDRLTGARESVDRIARVLEAAAGEWRARGGKSAQVSLREYGARPFAVTPTDAVADKLAYTRGGSPGSLRLGALDVDAIAALATSGGRDADASLALGVASLFAACGRAAEAEALAAKAAALGASSATFATELAAVKANLLATASREIAAGDAMLERSRDGARAAYGRAALLAPFLATPHARLAAWLTVEKKPDEALAEWRRAAALGDASPDTLHGLAKAAAAAGRPDEEVLEAWRAFVAAAPPKDPRLDPAKADVERLASRAVRGSTLERVRAAKALLDAGKVAEAVTALEEAVAADPGSLEAQKALARAAEKAEDVVRAYLAWRDVHAASKTTKDATEAKEQLERLLRTHGERSAELVVRKAAEASTGRGELATAVEGFKRALGMSPLDAEARMGLGGALLGLALRTGNKALFEEGYTAYDLAVKLAPDDPRGWAGRGELRRWKGDYDGAVADASVAIERRKDFYPAYNTRGLAHYQSLRFDAALADLDVVCTLAPLFVTPRVTRAGILVAMGRFADAEADLVGALERNPTDAEKQQIEALRAQAAARKKAVGGR